MSDPWRGDRNAELYDRWARTFGMYRASSSFLVDFASISTGERVVDLCCGTGITTEEILKRIGRSGHVWCVDGSEDMLAQAKRHIDAANVDFVCWPAESFHIAVRGPADAVICNSAFWQTHAHQSLSSARRVLRRSGRLALNVMTDQVKLDDTAPSDRGFRESPLNRRLHEIAMTDYGYVPRSSPQFVPSPPLDRDGWANLLDDHGFVLVMLELSPNENDAESYYEWLRIPVFSTRLLPGLPYDLKMEIFARARAEVGLDESDEPSHWVNMLAEAQ